ncbi:MAG: cytochrome c biogenesis protein CcsA, partial [Planctomycetia bacterium]|nr:cytochrome c biogenesis protein CcsA [Planctomycetia bacterium]
YSSAIFIGLGCVALGLVLEKLYPIGIGNVLASILGLATTIVAHNLASEDTLEMMQAVLDTNFWLATHVTTITLGYTATFVAGFLGVLYVLQMLGAVIRDSFLSKEEPTVGSLLAFGFATVGVVAIPVAYLWFAATALDKFEVIHSAVLWGLFVIAVAAAVMYAGGLILLRVASEGTDAHGQPIAGQIPNLAKPLTGLALTPENGKILGQMIYGVLCFATLLSFVGTVLGGIWADQSWGRFWGWDPKENGAVLIVLWNSLILHARWAGLVKERGVAVLAIFGNIVTAWSWFGTNQLGIGLHAYGFDTRLADGCFNFWVAQLAIMAFGLIPQQFWASASRRSYPPSAPAAPMYQQPLSASAPPAPSDSPTSTPSAQATGQPKPQQNGQPNRPPGGKKKKGKRR